MRVKIKGNDYDKSNNYLVWEENFWSQPNWNENRIRMIRAMNRRFQVQADFARA